MLHEVCTDQLRIGKFIKSIDCSWLTSPFWRRQFDSCSRADDEIFRNSGVVSVTIDDSKGVGSAAAATPSADNDRDASVPAIEPRARRHGPPTPSELDSTRATVERSRVAAAAIFADARMRLAAQNAAA